MPRNAKRGDGFGDGEGERNTEVRDVIKTILNDGADTSRLLELYYWTREPGIIELIRAYLDLPERTQRSLSTFLLNGRPKAVGGAFDPQGRLILSRGTTPELSQPAGKPIGAPATATSFAGSTRRA
ncbi:MAG: hypothetical protein KIT48_19145 [Pseudolabrys sp.]|jgi:hypothetical protein|nr:hypothetical protein [Pseudolabrys sp.]